MFCNARPSGKIYSVVIYRRWNTFQFYCNTTEPYGGSKGFWGNKCGREPSILARLSAVVPSRPRGRNEDTITEYEIKIQFRKLKTSTFGKIRKHSENILLYAKPNAHTHVGWLVSLNVKGGAWQAGKTQALLRNKRSSSSCKGKRQREKNDQSTDRNAAVTILC